jgi:hypothetical protein
MSQGEGLGGTQSGFEKALEGILRGPVGVGCRQRRANTVAVTDRITRSSDTT